MRVSLSHLITGVGVSVCSPRLATTGLLPRAPTPNIRIGCGRTARSGRPTADSARVGRRDGDPEPPRPALTLLTPVRRSVLHSPGGSGTRARLSEPPFPTPHRNPAGTSLPNGSVSPGTNGARSARRGADPAVSHYRLFPSRRSRQFYGTSTKSVPGSVVKRFACLAHYPHLVPGEPSNVPPGTALTP